MIYAIVYDMIVGIEAKSTTGEAFGHGFYGR